MLKLSGHLDALGHHDLADRLERLAMPTFWRSPSGYSHPSRATAWDILLEMTEAGNEDFLEMALASGLPLKQIPANECVWVARDRASAETYNRGYDDGYGEDEDGFTGPPNPQIYSLDLDETEYRVIIPDDGDGGMWIWTPGVNSQS